MIGKTNIGGGSGIELEIQSPINTTVTIRNLDNQQIKTKNSGSTGIVSFKGLKPGNWEEKITKGSDSYSKNIELKTHYKEKLDFHKIFGIKRPVNIASPEWTRTNDAVGMTAIATDGEKIGSSDFSKYLPWSGMVKETLPTGDVMVKIPAFYYRRYRQNENGAVIEHIEICEVQREGFELHPAFRHNNTTQKYIYVAAYQDYNVSNNTVYKSLPDKTITNAHWHSTHKKCQEAKGTGWGMIDLATYCAIQLLYLVEFANNDSQSIIGRGVDSGSMQKTGTSNNIMTGSPAKAISKSVAYRYIENLWGNCEDMLDGYVMDGNTGEQYFCLNQSDYNSSTANGPDLNKYTKISFLCLQDNKTVYYTELGYDELNPWVILPANNTEVGSSKTYYCDIRHGSTKSKDKKYISVGRSKTGDQAGLFAYVVGVLYNAPSDYRSSRGIYIPDFS